MAAFDQLLAKIREIIPELPDGAVDEDEPQNVEADSATPVNERTAATDNHGSKMDDNVLHSNEPTKSNTSQAESDRSRVREEKALTISAVSDSSESNAAKADRVKALKQLNTKMQEDDLQAEDTVSDEENSVDNRNDNAATPPNNESDSSPARKPEVDPGGEAPIGDNTAQNKDEKPQGKKKSSLCTLL